MEDKGEIVIYQTQDGTTQLDVKLDGETVWITQDQMTQLFQRDKSTISRHIKNIFEDGELDENYANHYYLRRLEEDGKYWIYDPSLGVKIEEGL